MIDPRQPSPRPADEAELVELLRSIDTPAPESLHRRVDAMIATRSARARRSRRRRGEGPDGAAARPFGLGPRFAAGGAILAAVIALAVAVGLSGSSSTLSVRDAAALTLRPATAAPPAENSSDRTELTAAVDGVSFPYWGGHFGWRSSGSRTDKVDGRTATTIFYENGRGQRVGYAIVAGGAPTQSSGGVVSHHDGTPYRLLTIDGAPVVTWLRSGHLCVVSGHGVSGATLLRLASWDDRRSTRA
ncbi:MAG TPA: hypothetical protein VHW67_13970 [Solirubrobacteraceae bacterium]|jgi:hypothetical protein|nr:hypothetical protein [Solirubrobacteraceae bacterium]